MSEFSDFCNMLREKSGMTIYSIAKVSEMERTALNRMLNGKRLPGYEDVERFCGTIRANEKEKEHIRKLYMMERMGKKRYANCCYIEKLLYMLDQGGVSPLYFSEEPKEKMEPDNTSFVEGETLVCDRILDMLEQAYQLPDSDKIYTNFPANDEILLSAVRFYEKKYRKQISLHHFHILNVNPEQYYDADCNLKVLCAALIWTFFKEKSYIPYYTYSPLMLNDLELQMMPFYLVTGARVAHISDDFRQGIFLENPDTVSFYKKKMRMLRDQMKKLFYVCQTTGGSEGREPLYSLHDMEPDIRHLDVELYEKSVVISKYHKKRKTLDIVITESSLCEAFTDYFVYREEVNGVKLNFCGILK